MAKSFTPSNPGVKLSSNKGNPVKTEPFEVGRGGAQWFPASRSSESDFTSKAKRVAGNKGGPKKY